MDMLLYVTVGIILGWLAAKIYRAARWHVALDMATGVISVAVAARMAQTLRLGLSPVANIALGLAAGLLVAIVCLFIVNVLRRV